MLGDHAFAPAMGQPGGGGLVSGKHQSRESLSVFGLGRLRAGFLHHFFTPAFFELFAGAFVFAFFLSLPCALLPLAMINSFLKSYASTIACSS